MITFTTTLQRFDKKGEKSGWTFLEVPSRWAQKLKPDCKVSFRVKGKLDQYSIRQTALIPMGDGNFILPFNATLRKGTGKKTGDKITVQLELEEKAYVISPDLMKCLKEEPPLLKFFQSLTGGHQRYFSKWIESAKTKETKARRIAMAMIAFSKQQGYSEMIRENKGNRM